MTTTKTEFELLIENLTMEDILYGNKNMLLQHILSNLPKDIVNIIDTLSNEVIPPHFTTLLENSSLNKLCDILAMFSMRLTNIKCSRVSLTVRKEKIISVITEQLNNIDNPTTLVDKIIKDHFTKKTKNIDWVNEFVVGEEVLVWIGLSYKKGIIKKINTKSVDLSQYAYHTVYRREDLKKRGEDDGAYDRYFLEGEWIIDYEN